MNYSVVQDNKWMGWLDRATETKWCLLVWTIVVAADVTLCWSLDRNLLTLEWQKASNIIHPGTVGIFIAGYLLYMAMVAPTLLHLANDLMSYLQQGVGTINASLFKDKQTSNYSQPPSPVEVSALDLRNEALQTKDDFELQLVTHHDAKIKTATEHAHALSRISFAGAALMLIESFSSGSALTTLTGTYQVEIGLILTLLVAIPWLAHVWLPSPSRRIYYPPLAKKRLEQWRRAKDF